MNKIEKPNQVDELKKLFDKIDEEAKAKAEAKSMPKSKSKSKEKTEKRTNIHKDHRKRMDEKVELGLENLAVHEQLEWILYLTIRVKDTNEIAHRLIDKFGTLQGVFNASEKELRKIKGVNHRTAILLRKMNDLAGLILRSWQDSVPLDTDKQMFDYVKSYFVGKNMECSYMFILDSGKRVKSVVKLAEGISDETPLYFQSVSRIAATQNANMVIIAHNHPEGNCEPSKADEYVVKNVEQALSSVGVKLYDSIIVTEHTCFSMKNAGMLLFVKVVN